VLLEQVSVKGSEAQNLFDPVVAAVTVVDDDDRPTPGTQDAVNLPERERDIRRVMEDSVRGNAVEALIGKGKFSASPSTTVPSSPRACRFRQASSTCRGVRSIPVTFAPASPYSQRSIPWPQPTSSTLSPRVAA
jgi:hypothetical protein